MSHFLRVLLYFLVLIYSSTILAQENQQSPPKFPIGAFLGGAPSTEVLTSYDSSGLNTVVYYAKSSTQTFLQNYDVIANNTGSTDWIQYYSTGYYSRWEGEQDTTIDHVGVKHKYGKDTIWQNIKCWSSIGVTAPVCSLMYGPHYRQEQRYKRVYQNWGVNYIPRFHLALSNPHSLNTNRNICVLKVVYRYTAINKPGYFYPWTTHDTTLLKDTLKISDFPQDSSFEYFNILENGISFYRYPDIFQSTITGDRILPDSAISPPDSILRYSDIDNDNGIQFWVDYLGNDSTTLFIDFAEVYDNNGWNHYIEDPDSVKFNLITYLQNHSTWSNIINWYGQDEPYSLDSFTPIYIVDSILQHNGGAPLMQEFQTGGNLRINGDTIMNDYMRIAKPKILTIDPYPFSPEIEQDQFWFIQDVLQKTSQLDTGFWFVGQGFGRVDSLSNWSVWRRPNSKELKAEVMLALSQGAKGILFWNYDSYGHFRCIVDSLGNPSDLWYLIHDNLAPRLKGILGDRLLKLKYSGYFVDAKYFVPTDDPNPQTFNYLTIPSVPSASIMDWHTGFFYRKGCADDNYFFLVNLLTDRSKSVPIKLTPPVPNFINYRFRNYEGNFDTTFTGTQFTYTLTHPAGEGYLYEVAPVVKYGGKLYTSEQINNNTTLYDDMTIENGVTLSVNATYECYANIITKGTGKIQTVNGGTIHFHYGKGIIAEGHPQILGTSSHKLTLDFGSTSEGTGIQILQGAQFIMNYCILKNSVNLVTAENSQFQTSINHCDFQNTSSYAISLSGASTRVPGINYCTFTNTDYGIFAAGQSSITINQNTFTDNKFAVNLSQIPDVEIIFNTLTSSSGELPGIFLNSCGGNIRANTITGHSIGISLANSSPVIGDNDIYDNKINGMYVGSGSVPDLRGALVGNPPLIYPISGYNSIYDNGGYNASGGEMPGDDGSEIYFSQSNIQLENGCNLIADDRTVSPPLITTLLLMNGSTTNRINAIYNAWGDTVYPARFGTLTVNYSPYYEQPCLLPQIDGLTIQNKDGIVIDTVYSAGSPVNSPSDLDLQYSEASQDMINLDFTSAETVYNSIISAAPSENASEKAYLGLYKSARLRDADSTELASLRELYNTNLEGITDTVMRKMVAQLALLTLIDERQYNNAINGFGDIINQNPQSEEALFAEIDAMTTSLLAGNGNDTTLNKGLNKSLLVKGTTDFQTRMNKLIQKKFGIESDGKKKQIIPTEYSLYYNYPNPFNPTTVIRFDIPEKTQIELVIYDILGRKVKTLVNNEVKNPGRYEVSFNANALASGVYIYKLTTKNYSQARKMLLIK